MSDPLGVLVVDDEANIRRTLRLCLEADGARVVEATSAEGALAALGREPFDLALLDLRLGQDDGLQLIPALLARQLDLPIVVITAHASYESAVEAIKRGARDYLPKPFTPAQVRHRLATLAAERRTQARLAELEERVREAVPEADLETRSPAMRAALDLAFRAAGSEAAILIRGETGTGKTVLARAIHARSPRAAARLVTVNGATLSGELLASELFGHVRGAFTGAVRDQAGKVDAARGGTLFLDEVGEVDPGVQAKLLRLLADREYERVGDPAPRRADVRFVTATNRDLAALVASGRFREDLLFRLNVIELTLPPLRERPEDIEPLAARFLAFFSRGRPRPLELSPAARARLRAYAWPGNVRELKNAIERAAILSAGDVIDEAFLPGGARPDGRALRLGDLAPLDDVIDEHIERVVAGVGTLEEAARVLGVDRVTIWRRRKRRSV
ncbi:MAG: sigma-54-dependent Fis family transcriptional regulator [Planctomycetota bacterium]|nr:sigma-54-dependent Fis family transcriptional regulator [Planctomycetota bacterium]